MDEIAVILIGVLELNVRERFRVCLWLVVMVMLRLVMTVEVAIVRLS